MKGGKSIKITNCDLQTCGERFRPKPCGSPCDMKPETTLDQLTKPCFTSPVVTRPINPNIKPCETAATLPAIPSTCEAAKAHEDRAVNQMLDNMYNMR